MSGPALLAEVWRGGVVEVAVRGHVAAVDASGRVLAAAGDPEAVTTVRSTVKPLQALPFVARAAGSLGCGEDEVAVACASHEGEPVHVATVRRLLGRAGVGEERLGCGPQWPYSETASRALAAAGEAPGRVHNNCSGKHAGMLAACSVEGWPLAGYMSPEHPLQVCVREAMTELSGVDLLRAPVGVDGCGLPTHGIPLGRLARAFGRAATLREDFRRCQAAMAAHPHLVGGTGRFDTALLGVAGDRLTAKSGGAAVWAAVTRPAEIAVAVKLEAGTGAHLAPIAIAVLQALDLLPADLPAGLREHAAGALRNWAGDVVGGTRVSLRLRRDDA